MVKRILFVCKHNIFRSRVAKILFDRMNRNKNYSASSAGIVKWDKKDLKNNVGYFTEKKVGKNFGIDLTVNSKGLHSSLLKDTDIVVIVADDVPPSIFREERAFNGKIFVWKTRDVKPKDKNKKKIAENTIKYIEKKMKEFVKELK